MDAMDAESKHFVIKACMGWLFICFVYWIMKSGRAERLAEEAEEKRRMDEIGSSHAAAMCVDALRRRGVRTDLLEEAAAKMQAAGTSSAGAEAGPRAAAARPADA